MTRPAKPGSGIAAIAELLSSQPRAAMVTALMGDYAMPASQLASIARVSRPTASEHLARLTDQGVLAVERIGRNAYYRISGPQMAEVIEALAIIAPVQQPRSLRTSRLLAALSSGRTCYKHLAGRIGVRLTDALFDRGLIARGHAGPEIVVPRWNERRPLGLAYVPGTGRPVRPVKGCVDWSERRTHLAGPMAAALTDRLFDLGWIARTSVHKRAVVVTAAGAEGLPREFGLDLSNEEEA